MYMVNQSITKKSSAHAFFADSKVSASPSVEFSTQLREQVGQAYINYHVKKRMENPFRNLLSSPKFFVFSFMAVAVLVLGGGFAYLNLSNKQPAVANTPNKLGAEVAYSEGRVSYATNGNNWQPATNDLQLQEGYSIRVEGNGRAIINLDDGSAARLNSDSQVTLTSLTANQVVITNDNGEVYTRVVKAERSFEVVAGPATYQSLGTAYKTIKTDKYNGVEVYQSQVAVKTQAAENVVVKEGNKYYIKNTVDTTKANKTIAIDVEEIKKDTFVIWNKEQDQKVSEYKNVLGVLDDLNPPVLTITAPQTGSTTKADKVTVQGTTEAGAKVYVNGAEVTNNNGSFSKEVALNIGSNTISVKAMDASGNKTYQEVKITREAVVTQTAPKPTTTTNTTPKISLTGKQVSGGIQLNWSLSNLDAPEGFKIVKSTTANPVYPDNSLQYMDASARSATLSIKDGKTYHFRVCKYTNGSCTNYSNDITVTAPSTAPVSSVSSISLSGTGTSVSWSVNGTAANGFKLVWSKTSGPTYPVRSGDNAGYYSSGQTSGTVSAFAGPGTYYVRVCEYLNGTCGVYSNQIQVTLD
jgi:hypothetical protein